MQPSVQLEGETNLISGSNEGLSDTEMASSTDSSVTVDEEARRLYERYQAAETDADRRKIAL